MLHCIHILGIVPGKKRKVSDQGMQYRLDRKLNIGNYRNTYSTAVSLCDTQKQEAYAIFRKSENKQASCFVIGSDSSIVMQKRKNRRGQ